MKINRRLDKSLKSNITCTIQYREWCLLLMSGHREMFEGIIRVCDLYPDDNRNGLISNCIRWALAHHDKQ